MADTPPQLLEVTGQMRITRDAQEGPFHLDDIALKMQMSEHVIDVMTTGLLKRKQMAMTIGANLIYLRASKPITVYYGISIEGHVTDFFFVHGFFPKGILVSADSGTEIRLVIAKEAS